MAGRERLAQKWKQRQRAKTQLLSREVCSKFNKYERGAAAGKAKKVHDCLEKNHSLAFSEMFKTSLNFVNVRFAILLTLLTLHCTWPTVQKHVPCF